MKGYGYKVGYYTNKDYIQNRIDKARLPYDLWLADYSGSPDYTCAIQQTSSTGKVGGISGNVDMKRLKRSQKSQRRLLNSKSEIR